MKAMKHVNNLSLEAKRAVSFTSQKELEQIEKALAAAKLECYELLWLLTQSNVLGR